jgi:uncharacterized protein (UPF0548 family)
VSISPAWHARPLRFFGKDRLKIQKKRPKLTTCVRRIQAAANRCACHTEGVFTFARVSAALIEHRVAVAANLPLTAPPVLSVSHSRATGTRLPFGFAYDFRRSRIGTGPEAFKAAKSAFQRWTPFDLGWARVANPDARIVAGQVIAVEIRTLGLWTLNLSRIREVTDTPTSFGFIYVTTTDHVERGEERFFIEFDPASGDVAYELEAFSRPRHPLAILGFPLSRSFQHRFARDSHRRMREEAHDAHRP